MKKKTTTTAMAKMPEQYEAIRTGIVDLLKSARSAAARNVNSIMTAVYWEIGRRIVESEQSGRRRADYGERLIERLSADLTKQFGRGFGTINLWRMRAFYQAWPEKRILSAPMKESGNPLSPNDLKGALSPGTALVVEFLLPWTSYGRLLSVRRPEARKFYETEALRCGWTTRQRRSMSHWDLRSTLPATLFT
jgi:hypothetical protein